MASMKQALFPVDWKSKRYIKIINYRWWFQICFIFTPICGKFSNLTNIFSDELKPPTSKEWWLEGWNWWSKNFPTNPWNIPKRPPTNWLWFGIPFIWGFGDSWGMLQGYVGVLLGMIFCVSLRSVSVTTKWVPLRCRPLVVAQTRWSRVG